MPSKNSIKLYVENGHYHIYNRGVEKRNIFLDDQDYRVFLNLLRVYLSPSQENFIHPFAELSLFTQRVRPLKCFAEDINLLAYCLMPNHFHLLINQSPKDGMAKFIQALGTSYTIYFNKKYDRVGPLFQGPYKAALILDDPYLLHVSRYIHLNPIELTRPRLVNEYPFSSYAYYLGKKDAVWVKTEPILSYFKTAKRSGLKDFFSYQSFVEDNQEDASEVIGDLSLE